MKNLPDKSFFRNKQKSLLKKLKALLVLKENKLHWEYHFGSPHSYELLDEYFAPITIWDYLEIADEKYKIDLSKFAFNLHACDEDYMTMVALRLHKDNLNNFLISMEQMFDLKLPLKIKKLLEEVSNFE